MNLLKKICLIILILFYIVAGVNHFRAPNSYFKIIPSYIPFPALVNWLSGFFEIAFAILMIFKQTRTLASWGIILMLIAFIPVHTKMVTDAPLMLGGTLKITPLVAWLRLLFFQPLLILWAWWYTRD